MIIDLYFKLFDYGWLILPLIMPLLAVFYLMVGQKYIRQNPDLKAGYNRIFFWYGGVASIPFIFMAYEIMVSNLGMIYNLLEPDFINPSVMGTWISSIILDVLFFYWIFFKNGAKMLYSHPGILKIFNKVGFYKMLAFFMPSMQILIFLIYHQAF